VVIQVRPVHQVHQAQPPQWPSQCHPTTRARTTRLWPTR
jgi:hypothetical protein